MLLVRLGLVAGRTLTPLGEQVRRLPLHPRLARMLIASGGAREVVRACALLSERHLLPPRTATTSSDVLSALDQWRDLPPHVHRTAEQLQAQITDESAMALPDLEFRRAIFAGYPDRVAQRREPRSDAFLLSSGTGAKLGGDSGVRDAEFIVALDVTQSGVGSRQPAVAGVATIRMASRVEREWLVPTASEIVHRFDPSSGRVRAARRRTLRCAGVGRAPRRNRSGDRRAVARRCVEGARSAGNQSGRCCAAWRSRASQSTLTT